MLYKYESIPACHYLRFQGLSSHLKYGGGQHPSYTEYWGESQTLLQDRLAELHSRTKSLPMPLHTLEQAHQTTSLVFITDPRLFVFERRVRIAQNEGPPVHQRWLFCKALKTWQGGMCTNVSPWDPWLRL